MRRPVAVIDQLPGSLFVTGAVLALGLIKAARTLARLERNQGALELTGILVGACFVGVMITARTPASPSAGCARSSSGGKAGRGESGTGSGRQ